MSENKSKDKKNSKDVVSGGGAIARGSRDFEFPTGATYTVMEMTGRQESTLRDLHGLKAGKGIEKVIAGCIESASVEDVLGWLRGDRLASILYIRLLSYGDTYTYKINCPHCGEENRKDINLADMGLIKPSSDISNNLKLPKSGFEVELRPLTGRDERKILEHSRKNADTVTAYELYLAVVTINGKSKEEFGGFEVFLTLPALDNRALKEKLNEIEPDVDTRVTMSCSSCRKEFSRNIPFDSDFFYPEGL